MALHCPAGHGPFEDWADRCPECGAVLVGREPIVLLTTAPNETVAQLWIQMLRRSSIRAMATSLGPGFGGWGTAVPSGHAIYVLAPDLDRARRVLAGRSGSGTGGLRRPHRPVAGRGPRRPARTRPDDR
jgi:hypothetical protein